MSSWPHTVVICAEPASPFQEPHEQKYHAAAKVGLLIVGLAAGACAIVFDSHDLGASIAACLFWLVFYLLLLHSIVDNCPSSLQKNSDGTTKAELFVSLVHQVGVMGGLLIAFLALHVNNNWSEWWKDGPVYAFTLERQVQLSIFGYELKDFEFGCIHWTWLVHHSLTLAGCIFVLFMPAGLGLLSLNAIIAELGSAVYNLQVIFPSNATKILYFIGMFLSNGIVVAFMVLLFFVDDLGDGWKAVYAVIVILLFLLRTEGLRRAVCEFLSDPAQPEVALEAKEEPCGKSNPTAETPSGSTDDSITAAQVTVDVAGAISTPEP